MNKLLTKLSVFIITFFCIMFSTTFADTVVTNVDNVPLQFADKDSHVTSLIPNGTSLNLEETTDSFYKISYNGQSGWIGKTYTIDGMKEAENAVNFLTVARQCKEFYSANGYKYSNSSAYSDPARNRYATTDCSTYVSWALYRYAQLKGLTDLEAKFERRKYASDFIDYAESISKGNVNPFFELVNINEADIMPGDILCYSSPNHHVEIFVGMNEEGRPLIYSCGSDYSIRKVATHKYSMKTITSAATCILRVKV